MIKKISAIILLLSVNVPLAARDIDLDAIYLKKDSAIYRQITSSKEKLYDRISSLFIDSNVVYAGWSGGDDIIYIKEFPKLNIVYKYIRSSRSRVEIARFSGTVTAAFLNKTGNFLYTKNLYYNDDAEAVSETLTINTGSGEVKRRVSGFLFLDFTLHPSGSGLVYQAGQGIVKSDSFTGDNRLIYSKDIYSGLSSGGEPVLAFISPDLKKTVFTSGSGGSYKTKIVTSSGEVYLSGVSSNTDPGWIDNNRFIYRSGGGGDYSVRVFDVITGKSRELISGTLNPDINFSEISGMITCLDNQLITVFSRDLRKKIDTGLEGEESYFSPDGRRFTSIYLGKLYVSSLNMVEKYRIEIRRSGESLLQLYRKAAETKSAWESGYTPEYISKKIKQYDSFLKINETKR